MITRPATDIQLFVLYLNPVTGHVQDMTSIAVSTDHDALVRWYYEQMAPEKYRDEGDSVRNMIGGSILKTFKHGSILEYYNPCPTTNIIDRIEYGGGIVARWFREEDAMEILNGSAGESYEVVCRD